jgi:hypothetical protein
MSALSLRLLHQTGLDGLHRYPDALRAAVGELDADPLEVRAKLAFRDAGHVRADAAALLGLTLAVDDAALNGTTTGDYADFSHGDFYELNGQLLGVSAS